MSATLIINARVVNEGRTVEADVRLRDGRIAQVGQGLTCYGDEELVDAAGRYLLPGVIDARAPAPDAGPDAVAALVAAGITSCLGLSAAAAAGLVNHAGDAPRPPADDEAPVDLRAALDAVIDGRDTLEALVERVMHAPARRFQVAERGYIREDWWADLVVVDLEEPTVARVVTTWVNGEKVWDDGRVPDGRPGRQLDFAR